MKIFIAKNGKETSKEAFNDIIDLLKNISDPVICTASGDSPKGLYKEIVRKANNKKIDLTKWYFLSLDEWVGLNGNDEGSCRSHLDKDLFFPLNIDDDKICFFDGRSSDINKETERIENFIDKKNGIDIAIIGIGLNGHIGMNEPGTSINSKTHISILDPITQKTGQKYFKNEQQLTAGITLGIDTIMKAKNIFLIVSGKHKAEIIKRTVEENISEFLPASLLKDHPGFKIYLDEDAASLINIDFL